MVYYKKLKLLTSFWSSNIKYLLETKGILKKEWEETIYIYIYVMGIFSSFLKRLSSIHEKLRVRKDMVSDVVEK